MIFKIFLFLDLCFPHHELKVNRILRILIHMKHMLALLIFNIICLQKDLIFILVNVQFWHCTRTIFRTKLTLSLKLMEDFIFMNVWRKLCFVEKSQFLCISFQNYMHGKLSFKLMWPGPWIICLVSVNDVNEI